MSRLKTATKAHEGLEYHPIYPGMSEHTPNAQMHRCVTERVPLQFPKASTSSTDSLHFDPSDLAVV